MRNDMMSCSTIQPKTTMNATSWGSHKPRNVGTSPDIDSHILSGDGLWMVGSTQLEGYIVELKLLFPESTDEYFVTASHYCRG